MRTLDLAEAADFLHIHKEELRVRAKRGVVPGARVGRRWVFLEQDLADYLRSLYTVRRQALKVPSGIEVKQWHSSNVEGRGGSGSPRSAEKRIRCSAGTSSKAEAQEYHDKLKSEAWRVGQLGEKVSRTWDDAGYKWLLETQHKATHEDDKAKLVWLQTFLRGKELNEINRELIEKIGEAKRAEATAATANRYLALIRSILRKASLEWEWIDRVPKIRLYSEPKRRIEWLTPQEVKTLVRELPEHQRDIVLFALVTGLRQANITNLEWSQVDLARRVAWIHPDQAKVW